MFTVYVMNYKRLILASLAGLAIGLILNLVGHAAQAHASVTKMDRYELRQARTWNPQWRRTPDGGRLLTRAGDSITLPYRPSDIQVEVMSPAPVSHRYGQRPWLRHTTEQHQGNAICFLRTPRQPYCSAWYHKPSRWLTSETIRGRQLAVYWWRG